MARDGAWQSGAWAAVAGGFARRALVRGGAAALARVAARSEIITAYSSLESVREGAFLRGLGRSPYEGAVFRRSPVVLDVFGPLIKMAGDGPETLLVVVDVAIALVLVATAVALLTPDAASGGAAEEANSLEHRVVAETKPKAPGEKVNNFGRTDNVNGLLVNETVSETESASNGSARLPTLALLAPHRAPFTIAMLFMFNPYSMLACVGGNVNSLGVLAILVSLWRALRRDVLGAGLALGAALSLDLVLYAPLVVPVVLQVSQGRSRGGGARLASGALVVVIALATFVGIMLHSLRGVIEGDPLAPTSRSTVQRVLYAGLFQANVEVADLSPNVGLWWYFFIEVFEESQAFFKLAFQASPLLLVGPLSVSFSHRPQLLAHVLLVMGELTKPYPDVSSLGLMLTLFAMHPLTLKRMPNVLPMAVGVLSTSAMLPVMRHMWLTVGSGNANYYYFQTLICQFCATSLLVSFIRATLVRDGVLADEMAAATRKDD